MHLEFLAPLHVGVNDSSKWQNFVKFQGKFWWVSLELSNVLMVKYKTEKFFIKILSYKWLKTFTCQNFKINRKADIDESS
jgi:hypothetical protein